MENDTKDQVEKFLSLSHEVRERLLNIATEQGKSYIKTVTVYPCDIVSPMDKIISAVCNELKITLDDLSGKTRLGEVVCARHIIFYLLRSNKYGIVQIGRLFNRDHATVLYACEMHQERLDFRPDYARKYKRVVDLLKDSE